MPRSDARFRDAASKSSSPVKKSAMVEVTAEVVGDNILSLMLAVRRMKPLKDRLLGTLERLPKILIE